ncbi:MAG: hypothetical protein ABS81_05450 [Pseudonocardia sp. SCN 72-86]|nr:MAG: hypothetical protein ABS81_05450 [Pseudonocardia sp. SCN 72-86]
MTGACCYSEIYRSQSVAARQQRFALQDVLADGPHVTSNPRRFSQFDASVEQLDDVLAHHHGVAGWRERITCVDHVEVTGVKSNWGSGLGVGKIGRPHRYAIHRRRLEGRN